MAVGKEDIERLADVLYDIDLKYSERGVAEAILRALPIENKQGAGHSTFVERVRTTLEGK